MQPKLLVLGIRGIPGCHGGFETFAHHFAPWLVRRGWDVTVYCQHAENEPGAPADFHIDCWNQVRRVHLRVPGDGAMSTIAFDLRCALHASREDGAVLVLGYNTAIFNVIQRIRGQVLLMNMDGIEWKRAKWGTFAKLWFRLNEVIAKRICNVLIADHPRIADHLRQTNKAPVVIPYGAPAIDHASTEPIIEIGLVPRGYFVSICRLEPENSLLEVVAAFSSKPRNHRLVVLGKIDPTNEFHRRVIEAASPEVMFPGAIYDARIVTSLRMHCHAYVHGHQVGGTNPSLVEAMGVGNAIIAHDNQFNRWVAGDKQFYFSDSASLELVFDLLDDCDDIKLEAARLSAKQRHRENFTYDIVHSQYESMLCSAVQIVAPMCDA